jgi:hypothetical protein
LVRMFVMMENFIVIVIVGVASGFAGWWCLKFAKGDGGGGCGSCGSKSSCDKKSCDDIEGEDR